MFRELITSDPKTARRLFVFQVAVVLIGVGIGAWSIILRDWLFLAIWLVAEADMMAYAARLYNVGWPGSRLDSYTRFPRVSEAQWLLAGLVFLVATLAPLLVIGQGRKELVLGLIGLVSAVWLFRFLRVMRKEG